MPSKKKPSVIAESEPPLRLEWRSPAELAENPANWRTHPAAQIGALTGVIAEVGWAGACLFNETTGRLIDGHARRKVAMEQGAGKVPVLIGSWTEEQERKILATLDPIAGMAEADAVALAALLAQVHTESDAVQAMLDELKTGQIDIAPSTEPLPDIDETSSFTFVVVYDEEDRASLESFVELDNIPHNQMGKRVLERIKKIVANRADTQQ